MAATKTKNVVKTTAQNLESRFDAGANVLDYFDATTALRRNLTPRKVNVDFPAWVVKDLDKEADRLGVARQSLIKVWIVERLEQAELLARSGISMPAVSRSRGVKVATSKKLPPNRANRS
jgi:hypothetical protein